MVLLDHVVLVLLDAPAMPPTCASGRNSMDVVRIARGTLSTPVSIALETTKKRYKVFCRSSISKWAASSGLSAWISSLAAAAFSLNDLSSFTISSNSSFDMPRASLTARRSYRWSKCSNATLYRRQRSGRLMGSASFTASCDLILALS